jgi:hypothetical protein
MGQLGEYNRAIPMFHDVCQCFRQTLGLSHPATTDSFRTTAIFLYRQGKLHNAETSMIQALAGLEEKHGKGHEETFGAHEYIAALLHLQGQLQEQRCQQSSQSI